jgi:hypothetical protein
MALELILTDADVPAGVRNRRGLVELAVAIRPNRRHNMAKRKEQDRRRDILFLDGSAVRKTFMSLTL